MIGRKKRVSWKKKKFKIDSYILLIPTLVVFFVLIYAANSFFHHELVDANMIDRASVSKLNAVFDPYYTEKLPPFPIGSPNPLSIPTVKAISPTVYRPASNFKPAVPVLTYHHIREPQGITDKNEYWISVSPANLRGQLNWIKNNGYTTITLDQLFSGSYPKKSIVLTFDDGYQDNYDQAFRMLRENGQKGVFFIISNGLGGIYMTSAEIREMSDAGMEIESHSVTHPVLTTLSPEDQLFQFTKSKQDIEAMIGKTVSYFCYPYGMYNDISVEMIQKAGYRAAFKVKSYSLGGSMFELPRITVAPRDNTTSLASKIASFIYANSSFNWIYR